MNELEKFTRPLESIFATDEWRVFQQFINERNIKADAGTNVTDISHGGGAVGVIYRLGDLAIKVAKEIRLRNDINRERGIYLRLKGIPHIVQLQFAPEHASYLVIDFLEGKTADDFFADKSLDSKIARNQRIIILKQLLTALSEAMQRGLFLHDIDASHNNVASINDKKELNLTIFDVGDAIDCKEIEIKLKDALLRLNITLEREKQRLDRLEKDFTEKKGRLITEVEKIPESEWNKSLILTILGYVKDETFKKELLALITPKPILEQPKTEPNLGTTLKNLLLGAPQPTIPPYFSTSALETAVHQFNQIRTSDLDSSRNTVSQYETVSGKLSETLKNLEIKPEATFSLFTDFAESEKKRVEALPREKMVPITELQPVLFEIEEKYLGRFRDFANKLSVFILELLAEDFQARRSFNHAEEVLKVEDELKLPSQLVEVIQRGLSKQESDPYKIAQAVLEQLNSDQIKSYIEAGNDTEFFQITDAFGEPKAQRLKRYIYANEFFYTSLESKARMTLEEEERLVRETVEMLIGQKPLPRDTETLRMAMSNTGMHFTSTEEIMNKIAPLLTGRAKSEGRLILLMKQLFSSILLSGLPSESRSGHLYFSFKTEEQLKLDRERYELMTKAS